MNAEFKVGSALGAVVSPEDGDAADSSARVHRGAAHSADDSGVETWAELRRIARSDIQMLLRAACWTACPRVRRGAALRPRGRGFHGDARLEPRPPALFAGDARAGDSMGNAGGGRQGALRWPAERDWPSDHAPVAASFSVAYPAWSAERGGSARGFDASREPRPSTPPPLMPSTRKTRRPTLAKPPKGSGKKNKKKPTPEAIERKRRRRKTGRTTTRAPRAPHLH